MIGYTAGRDLKRMPSDAYWGGLGSWGLRRLDLSISEYGQQAAAIGRLRPERDDDGETSRRVASMWAPHPHPPDDFLKSRITFDLNPEEAQVLVDNIRRHHTGTLLAVLCGMPAAAKHADYPWKLPTDGRPGQPHRTPPPRPVLLRTDCRAADRL